MEKGESHDLRHSTIENRRDERLWTDPDQVARQRGQRSTVL